MPWGNVLISIYSEKTNEPREFAERSYNVYPILKTSSELPEIGPICPDFSSQGYDKNGNIDHFPLDLQDAIDYVDRGYGAIPDKSSHTGYVDLFGMPCVTQKQVEEGFKIKWN